MSFGLLGNLFDYTGLGMIRKPLKQATGMTDAQLAGAGLLAAAAPFALPALMGSGAGAGTAGSSPGLLAQFGNVAGPVSQGLGIASQVSALNQRQPIQGGGLPQRQGPDFSGLLNAQAQNQQAMTADQMQRQQMQQQYLQALMNGGNYGRFA